MTGYRSKVLLSASKEPIIDLDDIQTMVLEIEALQVYEKAIKHMCSVRYDSVDEYIRIAKQAVADYEQNEEE